MARSRLRELLGRWGRRGLALVVLATFLAALPAAALAHAAEPVTLADWMRTIFVTPDRETDRTSPAVVASPPAPPPLALQTSSQQVPPKQAQTPDRLPEGWVRRGLWRPGRRRRRRIRRSRSG